MCMSCGCGEPNADHGDPRHIVRKTYDAAGGMSGLSQQQLQDAADAAEISVDEVRSNIQATSKQ